MKHEFHGGENIKFIKRVIKCFMNKQFVKSFCYCFSLSMIAPTSIMLFISTLPYEVGLPLWPMKILFIIACTDITFTYAYERVIIKNIKESKNVN
jgi:hypothetical protein